MPRYIFTDNFNSLAHFVLGVLAVKFPILIVLFLFYQITQFLKDISWNEIKVLAKRESRKGAIATLLLKDNFLIDVLEFILGIITCRAILTLV
jgi:hypothetical protein